MAKNATFPETKILSRNFDVADAHTLKVAREHGAYKSLEKALADMTPEQVIEEVKTSRLRGRGGAGFPTGVKWGFVPKDSDKPKYICVNADESEPGTFKDRYLMELDPHLVIEGSLLAAYAVGAKCIYIYVRGEYPRSIARLEQAIEEATKANFLGEKILGKGFSCDCVVHAGAGAYICGEETGLLESLEGKRGHPRIKPPFPAIEGAFGCPTVINNVETLAHVPWILEHGGQAFADQGIAPDPDNPRSMGSAGTKLMGVSGGVKNPGVWEFEFGITARQLIYEYAGGPLEGRSIKAVIPGGMSMPVLTDEELDVKMGFDDLVKVGSGLGTACAIVMDDTVDMVEACENIAHFFADESCGQCTPCREGCHWLEKIYRRINAGQGTEADLDLLEHLFPQIEGRTICALADAAVWPLRSILKKFRHEFEAKLAKAPAATGSALTMSTQADERPTISIDGQELAYEPGQTVIQVAKAAGIEIPHYCYHPGLSIAGNCRICMVEVEGWPRPQIACKLQPSPGMIVKTGSEMALDARRATMEFLLVNHPLDCPICDQAGECHLQDLSYQLGQGTSRSSTEKTHGAKNVPFGGRIVYDGERCIKCTRCVRFTEEVTGTHELAMGYRSDHECVIMTSEGEFKTPYSMNIIDICPVGALTSRDFRFQSRLWFMDFAPSVCTGCARGCNVMMGARQGEFLRMEPRENQAVNRWWMCDAGRLGYTHVNSPTRLENPRVRGGDGVWHDATWDEAIDQAIVALKSTQGSALVDGGATLEEMWLLKEIAGVLGGSASYAGRTGADGDEFLIVDEKAANARGAELLGLERVSEPRPAGILVVERDEHVPATLREGTGAAVVFATDAEHVPASASVAFPFGSWAERDGTLVNIDGIAQRIRNLREAGPFDLMPAFDVLEEILVGLGQGYEARGLAGVLEAARGLPGADDLTWSDVVAKATSMGSAS